MNRTESTYSERIGARISPELKVRLQGLVDNGYFESEADAVREALWQFAEQTDGIPRPPSPDLAVSGQDLKVFEQRMEWLFSVMFILISIIGGHVVNAMRGDSIKPSALMDEAIQEAIYNRELLDERLKAGQAIAEQNGDHP